MSVISPLLEPSFLVPTIGIVLGSLAFAWLINRQARELQNVGGEEP